MNDLLNDERVQKILFDMHVFLTQHIIRAIENKFSTLEKYLEFSVEFGKLSNKASKMTLTKDDATKFALMRIDYNKIFGVDCNLLRKINKQFRYKGRIIRLPMKLIEEQLLLKYAIKTINHGKSFKKNYHWNKKFLINDTLILKLSWKQYHKVEVIKKEDVKEQLSAITINDENIDALIEKVEI